MRMFDFVSRERGLEIAFRAARRTRAALALAIGFIAAAVVLANVLAWLSGENGSVAAALVAMAITVAAGVLLYRLPMD
jgi:hypothetical protein